MTHLELPLDIFDQPTGDAGPVSDPASATAVLHPNLKDLIDKEQTFLVNFNLWQPQVPEEPTKKHKETPEGPRAYLGLTKSYSGPGLRNISQFKAISMPLFVIASLTSSTHTVMVFKIIHENPLKTIHAKHSLAWFLREPADNGKDKSEISNGEESVGSEGSEILSPGKQNLETLMQHFEKDFQAGENATSPINSKDPGQVCLLNTSCLFTWANDWLHHFQNQKQTLEQSKKSKKVWLQRESEDVGVL
ncbi:hypothetical protein DFH28DRAFT_1149495 [Melampsora americana]|nr:hypothetical protein DFH28DRAFT_1149495 [Melampsora americana]